MTLRKITVPEGVVSIDDEAFSDCKKLEKITLPKSLKSIGSHAFNNCCALKTVDLPDGLETIGKYVFLRCNHLEVVHLPNSVTTLGIGVLDKCSNLCDFHLPELAIDYKLDKCPYMETHKRLKELNKYAVKVFLDSLKKAPGCKYLKATLVGERGCKIALVYQKTVLWKSVYRTTELEEKVDELKAVAASYKLK
ncbi:MAG: leucine-rich repeat domain-containing protein [Paludibacteraceae bacterium]|nr:leucine-rich repeat domain-containing protein [Paludibacteraceae bacterium]